MSLNNAIKMQFETVFDGLPMTVNEDGTVDFQGGQPGGVSRDAIERLRQLRTLNGGLDLTSSIAEAHVVLATAAEQDKTWEEVLRESCSNQVEYNELYRQMRSFVLIARKVPTSMINPRLSLSHHLAIAKFKGPPATGKKYVAYWKKVAAAVEMAEMNKHSSKWLTGEIREIAQELGLYTKRGQKAFDAVKARDILIALMEKMTTTPIPDEERMALYMDLFYRVEVNLCQRTSYESLKKMKDAELAKLVDEVCP